MVHKAEGDLRPLGLELESILESGHEQAQSFHHKVARVHPEGLAGEHSIIRVGDRVLQVNGHVLDGLSLAEVTGIVLNTPPPLTIVVSRPLGAGMGEGQGTLNEETDGMDTETTPLANTEGNHTPSGPIPLPANIDFLLDDFSRRFERQSWRIRHEEERRRLKQKFEVSVHFQRCHTTSGTSE